MKTKMPWQGWLMLILAFGFCGFWTYLTPIDPVANTTRFAMLAQIIFSPYFLAGAVVLGFILLFPPKFRR